MLSIFAQYAVLCELRKLHSFISITESICKYQFVVVQRKLVNEQVKRLMDEQGYYLDDTKADLFVARYLGHDDNVAKCRREEHDFPAIKELVRLPHMNVITTIHAVHCG